MYCRLWRLEGKQRTGLEINFTFTVDILVAPVLAWSTNIFVLFRRDGVGSEIAVQAKQM